MSTAIISYKNATKKNPAVQLTKLSSEEKSETKQGFGTKASIRLTQAYPLL